MLLYRRSLEFVQKEYLSVRGYSQICVTRWKKGYPVKNHFFARFLIEYLKNLSIAWKLAKLTIIYLKYELIVAYSKN